MDDTIRDLALFLHISAAVVWIGGATMCHVIATALAKARDVAGMRSFCGVLDRLAGPVFGSTGVLTLVAGIVLVANADYFDFSDAFVSLGFLLLIVGMLLGAIVSSRRWMAVYETLKADGASWDTVAGGVASAQRSMQLQLVVLYAAIAVMVVKPGL